MARRQPRVVAVGDAIVDLITPPLPPIPPGDFQGHVPGVDALPGGNATNFALAIASLGARTSFVGAIGADPNGAVLRDAYRRHGVRAVLRVDPRRRTGAHHGARGERQPRPARRAFPVARRFGPPPPVRFLVDATPDRATDGPPPRARPAAGISDVPRRLDRPARLAGRPHRRGPRLPPERDDVLRERGRGM